MTRAAGSTILRLFAVCSCLENSLTGALCLFFKTAVWLPTSAVTSPAMAFDWVHDTTCGFCAVGQATVRKWLVTVVTDWPLLREQADPVG